MPTDKQVSTLIMLKGKAEGRSLSIAEREMLKKNYGELGADQVRVLFAQLNEQLGNLPGGMKLHNHRMALEIEADIKGLGGEVPLNEWEKLDGRTAFARVGELMTLRTRLRAERKARDERVAAQKLEFDAPGDGETARGNYWAVVDVTRRDAEPARDPELDALIAQI